ncbi:hypothetical protein C942_04036 [Photobacterium marinum]|uniref:Uncharacterized protein n=1 Tax=Photobacterium marinum TaxID=1056511 RepID=L8J375_9GAMM|nr:hypothetical protein C942_04036 [Photobacterium marinum]
MSFLKIGSKMIHLMNLGLKLRILLGSYALDLNQQLLLVN